MDWKEFELIKNELFENKRMAEVIAGSSPQPFSKVTPVELSKELKNVRNLRTAALKIRIKAQELNKDFYPEIHKNANDLLENLDYSLWRLRSKPVNPRGPRPYPKILKLWIIHIITLAKTPAQKRTLVEFFSPGKEFDKWIFDLSEGRLTGPGKSRPKDEAPSDKRDFDWLNEFKRSQIRSRVKT